MPLVLPGPEGRSVGRAISLVAVTALAAVVGLAWYVSRARAERRLWAALERYAELEMAKERFSQRSTQR